MSSKGSSFVRFDFSKIWAVEIKFLLNSETSWAKTHKLTHLLVEIIKKESAKLPCLTALLLNVISNWLRKKWSEITFVCFISLLSKTTECCAHCAIRFVGNFTLVLAKSYGRSIASNIQPQSAALKRLHPTAVSLLESLRRQNAD